MSSRTQPPAFVRHAATATVGAAMGAAEIVPGFSGGTVALVAGIYPRLVATIRAGAHVLSLAVRLRFVAAWRAFGAIEWAFAIALLIGMATSIVLLAQALSLFIERQPVTASALFGGLVVGGALVAWRDVHDPRPGHLVTTCLVAVVTFLGLGLAPGTIVDPTLWMLFAGAAIAICAWILPGVSGAFLLLLMGLYPAALAAVSERQMVAIGVLLAGALVGLAAFSTLLAWLLARAHDVVLAAMVGLLIGSTRVLWPWPSADGMGSPVLGAPESGTVLSATLVALGAVAAVVLAAMAARRVVAPDPDGAVYPDQAGTSKK